MNGKFSFSKISDRVFTTLFLSIVIVTLSGCVDTSRPLYDDAAKMNNLSVGMTKAQMIEILGTPVSISARDDIECANYTLLPHSIDYHSSFPRQYNAVLINGKIIEYKQGSCYMDEAEQVKLFTRFNSLRIGMDESDALTYMGGSSRGSRTVDGKHNFECVDYVFNFYYNAFHTTSLQTRFVAFRNGKLIGFGNSQCRQEDSPDNFAPRGKYH